MKTLYILFFCFVMSLSYSQDPQLFQYDWKLQKIETVDSILTVPNNLIFNASFDVFDIIFGNCGPIDTGVDYNNSTTNLNILNANPPISPCPNKPDLLAIENFFSEHFIFDTDQTTILNPYDYSFEVIGNEIFLVMVNGNGVISTFKDDLLSQEEFLKQSVSIFPNPVSDILKIKSFGIAIQGVKIYDLNGHLIKEEKLNHNQIDVSQLPKGIYILSIETPVGILREKLVKN